MVHNSLPSLPSFYPASSPMAQCICELRERDIPEPYTLNPQPQPKLQNLSTSPKTLNPKPRSLNPTPELNQNLDTGPKPRIVDPQVRGSGPLLRSLSLSLWHKKALSKDCFLQACSRKGSDLETTRDTTTPAAMFYALEFILRDHFYISEPRERGPTHLPLDKGEPRLNPQTVNPTALVRIGGARKSGQFAHSRTSEELLPQLASAAV